MKPAAPPRWCHRLLLAGFALFLWLPTLDRLFHLDGAVPPNEKRLPAEFPASPVTLAGVQPCVQGLEAYFNDHFGFRNRLIRWHNNWKRDWFHDKDVLNVIRGRDGWLFFSEHRMVEHYRGTLPFTPQQLQDWQRLLERRRDWLAQRGADYVFLVAPDKQSVYGEYLPEWLRKVRPQTRLDQLVAYMREHSTVAVVDVRPALLAAKARAPVYLKTDTHWNELGGFVAYEVLARAVARQWTNMTPPLTLDDFTLRWQPASGGDMALLLGETLVESNAVRLLPKAHLPPLEVQMNRAEDIRFIGVASTQNPAARASVMIFRDSFANAWQSCLGHHFRQAAYLWQYAWDVPRLEAARPKVVVDEIVERLFNEQDPNELLRKDALKD